MWFGEDCNPAGCVSGSAPLCDSQPPPRPPLTFRKNYVHAVLLHPQLMSARAAFVFLKGSSIHRGNPCYKFSFHFVFSFLSSRLPFLMFSCSALMRWIWRTLSFSFPLSLYMGFSKDRTQPSTSVFIFLSRSLTLFWVRILHMLLNYGVYISSYKQRMLLK